MVDEMRANAKLQEEYDEAFDAEERVQHVLKLDKGSVSRSVGTVQFADLAFIEANKRGRKATYMGLTKSIGELGIATPIHVMVTEGYFDYLEEGGDPDVYEGFKYTLIDGFRRVYGATKNKITEAPAVIWDFKDKDKASELILVLSLLLNKIQKHNWAEVWYYYESLEMTSAMSPSTLEYLLQLEPGEAMRLKDIMLCDYPDVREELLSGNKTILQCYNMLQKYRKEEDGLLRDDQKGFSDVGDTEGVVDSEFNDTRTLTNDQVKNILDMEGSFEGDLSEEDFDNLMGNDVEDAQQMAGERHPLDPRLRAAVLQRDGYRCVVSGAGEGLPTELALSILNVHHKVPVHAGGTDTLDNLVTVSLDVHTLIHIIERRNGKLGMSKEDFELLSPERQEYIKGVMRIARIAVEANRRLGKTKDQVKEATRDANKFMMPGVVQSQNMNALSDARKYSAPPPPGV